MATKRVDVAAARDVRPARWLSGIQHLETKRRPGCGRCRWTSTVRIPVTVPPSDAAFSSSGGIATRTGDRKTTWLRLVSLDSTARNRVVQVPPILAAMPLEGSGNAAGGEKALPAAKRLPSRAVSSRTGLAIPAPGNPVAAPLPNRRRRRARREERY